VTRRSPVSITPNACSVQRPADDQPEPTGTLGVLRIPACRLKERVLCLIAQAGFRASGRFRAHRLWQGPPMPRPCFIWRYPSPNSAPAAMSQLPVGAVHPLAAQSGIRAYVPIWRVGGFLEGVVSFARSVVVAPAPSTSEPRTASGSGDARSLQPAVAGFVETACGPRPISGWIWE
jgi:hypothetical protein